jgi:site-specific DNA-cytosine methylase
VIEKEIRHFHLFCGLGGGAKGFNNGDARIGNMKARFRCIGGIDVDHAAIRDFDRLAGVPGTVLDLFDRDQYKDFHGAEPSADWREVTVDDIRKAAGGERPHIVFTSAPCKGFSGLLGEQQSKTDKYQALNRLTLRGIWLALEAWADDPVELVIFENVPRIASRGRHLLDQITALLRQYGYAVAETTHDCGELGGLAQSRKRFLLVARHREKVPPFLYEPVKRPLASVGSVLEHLPMPGDVRAGAMHSVPNLQWRTWVRLAFVEAGSDWRSLRNLRVENGMLKDFGIVPEGKWRNDCIGVLPWDKSSPTITGNAGSTAGKFSVADHREFCSNRNDYLGVVGWPDSCGAITGNSRAHSGRFNVADPRPAAWKSGFRNSFNSSGAYGVISWEAQCPSIRARANMDQGPFSVADPRPGDGRYNNIFRVVQWSEVSPAITGGTGPSAGGLSVADPRPAAWGNSPRENYDGGGHYGVIPWRGQSGAVSSSANLDNGRWSVADPRLPEPADNLVAIIRALDGTWHRPFTTLELAALQGLVDPEEYMELEGASHQSWRERIGNAVPPPAAQAIAGVMGVTLLLAWSGETFHMSSTPIWVRNVPAALMMAEG